MVGNTRETGIIFNLFLLYVNFLTVEVILSQVWTGSAAEKIKAWLPSTTSKSRQ